jgi:hypothetical protein
VTIEGGDRVLLREEANIVPFAAFTPIVYPHSHVGLSIYDLIADLAVIKTTLQRNYLDSVYLMNNGKRAVNINTVNQDDLLIDRPGAIVRVDGQPSNEIFPLVTPDSTASVLQGLEYVDAIKEGRTGVTRYSAGLDANTLNKTASGIQQIQAAANQRIEMIARTLASGFRDLFLIVHALACQHSTKATQMKLRGKWTPIDPRSWSKRTDFSISVGLGTGTPEQQLQKLAMLSPIMQQAMQFNMAGPREIYEFGREMFKAAGYRTPDKFLKEPTPSGMGPDGKPQYQMPPPPKDPVVQAKELDLQGKEKEMQAKMASDQQKAQQEFALQQSNDARQAEIDQRQHALEMTKMAREFEFKTWEKQQDIALEMWREQYRAGAQMVVTEAGHEHASKMEKTKTGETALDRIEPMVEQLMSAAEMISAPAEIIRGPDGRAAAVNKGGKVSEVVRGPDGRPKGLRPVQ